MADRPIEATVRETKESVFAVEVVVDGHKMRSDQPLADGGKNLGPYPHELLVAALGACTAQTVRWYAARHDIPLESVDVSLTYRREHVEGHSGLLDVFTKELHFVGAKLTPDQRAKLLDVAGKCPIQRLMEGMPVIHTAARVPAN